MLSPLREGQAAHTSFGCMIPLSRTPKSSPIAPLLFETQVLSFLAEWFDPLPQLTKQYLLKYFCDTNEAEMVEPKTKRLFLKRSPCPSHFTTKDFALGSKVG